jgi:hypothetical protein
MSDNEYTDGYETGLIKGRSEGIRAALEAAAAHVRSKYNRGDNCHAIQLQHEILLLCPDDILRSMK